MKFLYKVANTDTNAVTNITLIFRPFQDRSPLVPPESPQIGALNGLARHSVIMVLGVNTLETCLALGPP